MTKDSLSVDVDVDAVDAVVVVNVVDAVVDVEARTAAGLELKAVSTF